MKKILSLLLLTALSVLGAPLPVLKDTNTNIVTGPLVYRNPSYVTFTDQGPGTVVDLTLAGNLFRLTTNPTLTYSNSTPPTDTAVLLRFEPGSSTRTVTIPTTWNLASGANITSLTITASTPRVLQLQYSGATSRFEIFDIVGGGGGSGGTPGGSSGDLQYNNAGAFGGYTPGAGVVTFIQTPSSANLALAVTGETGSGALVFGTSPTLTTPTIGVATATSLNGNTFTAGTYTLTGTAAKTLTFTNSLTLSGTDGVVMTTPTTSFTAARTDAANTFTGIQSFTSPDITTSITTPSTSFTAFAGATTLMTIGGTGASASSFFPSTLDATSSTTGAIRTSGGLSAAKAANFGTTLNVAGISGLGLASSSTTNLNLAVSTTGVSSLRIGHGTAPTSPVNGDIWTTTSGLNVRINGSTQLLGTATGNVTAGGTLTSTALVTGAGTTAIQTPSATATMDSSGNISTPGTLTVGNAATTAGAVAFTQGTTQSTGTTNITFQAPAAVTSYIRTLPGAVGSTGYLLETVSGSVQTESLVAGTGTGNVVLSASPTLTGTIGGASLTLSSLTSGRVTFAGASGLLSDDSDMTFATDTLTTTNHVVTTSLDVSATGVRLTGSNGSITFLGRGSGSDEDLKLDLDTTSNTALVTSSTGVTTLSLGAIGVTGTGTNSIGPLVDSVDGTTPLNNVVETVATGTAYTLTTTYANVDFGTTDPVIVIPNAGTYMVYALIQTTLVGATATTQVVQAKCRRTNNTAADLGFASAELLPPGVAASIPGIAVMIVGGKYTTVLTNDSITIQAQLSAALGAGTVTVSDARIWAVRQY